MAEAAHLPEEIEQSNETSSGINNAWAAHTVSFRYRQYEKIIYIILTLVYAMD